MKKLLSIILSFLCVVALFCGCGDSNKDNDKKGTSLNLLGCGFEFGMTKDEVNKIGKKVTNVDEFNVESSLFKDIIDRDRIIEGAGEDLLAYKTNYYFDDKDKLYCIDFWLPLVNERDAEIILNNIISIYGKADEYKETSEEIGNYTTISTFTYKDKNIQVYITYDYSSLMKNGTIEFYLIAPGHELPAKD